MRLPCGPFGLLESFKVWKVSSKPFTSDHRYILFSRGLCTSTPDQESQGYQLGLLSRGTEGQTGEGPGINMKDEARLGLVILSVQQAIISSYEDNCPLKPAETGRHSVQWTLELRVPQKRSEKAL